MIKNLPSNSKESMIHAILVDNGYEPKEITFHGFGDPESDERIVKIGNWEQLDVKAQTQLSDLIAEDAVDAYGPSKYFYIIL